MAGTSVRYGRRRPQVAELWRPPGGGSPRPVVVLLHGGFWRGAFTKVLMRRLARAVVARGWVAWNVEYRRLGLLGGGGGWPATFEDVADALAHLRHVPALDLDRVVTCGHSAGGTLALWAAAGRGPHPGDRVESPVPVRGALSLAGVVDLVEADRLGLGDHATAALLGGHHGARPDRYRLASPAELLPLGVPQVLVHGLDDDVVPPSMSERYRDRAQECGDPVRYVPLPGVGHGEMIGGDGPAWEIVARALESLLA